MGSRPGVPVPVEGGGGAGVEPADCTCPRAWGGIRVGDLDSGSSARMPRRRQSGRAAAKSTASTMLSRRTSSARIEAERRT